ncbi:class I SAM-dependent methyltransferase [Methylobacterium haplocladii]|uniref:Methyltransferase type 11 domain-containing protein n=1 Tax=Methylobacterium haplocladii TaxID=1176176 RepID=A0A512IVY3_9HYPH|nr:class I SAM-dependent methyltransferase [Methylobacterium haplocladii]GEP01878.1 hypothetical protein MHA02_42650 [Methylobacterium haplocladii]GJD86443.1 Ubiquinone biosynthesis O-methyltransferase, mitochondrial [Methylobacterium haplocladii]GLS61168.1 hypothetical protein GCM10007887_38650 [Methylobacterium haplocladii]
MAGFEDIQFPREDQDESFEQRRSHAWSKIKWSVPETVKRGRFLDIGCGIGNGVVAALQHGFQTAIGIDRDLAEFPWVDVGGFDRRCENLGIDPARAILIGADLFKTSFPDRSFDCVFMLDSIEHVPDPSAFIAEAARYVAPGGVLLIDTCPLYYSALGAHLWGYLDPNVYPWAHLRSDFAELTQRAEIDEWTSIRVEELNRVTHDEIRRGVVASGLDIQFEHRSAPTPETSALLEQHRSNLDWSKIPDEGLLFEDWILIVGQRPLSDAS